MSKVGSVVSLTVAGLEWAGAAKNELIRQDVPISFANLNFVMVTLDRMVVLQSLVTTYQQGMVTARMYRIMDGRVSCKVNRPEGESCQREV